MRRWLLVGSLLLAACSVSDENNGKRSPRAPSPQDELPPGVVLDAAPASLRRLTPAQYKNTMRDLLGLSEADATTLVLPNDTGATPSVLTVTRLDEHAAAITTKGAHRRFVPCDVAGDVPSSCVDKFIDDFGSKAFRHPITDEERSWLKGIYDTARKTLPGTDAIDIVTRVILQAPALVYVHEEGEAKPGLPAGLLRLRPHEIASRLSYFMWDTMPDDALLQAASDGRLATSAGIKDQVTRMLDEPRTRAKMVSLVSSWLELDGSPRHVSIEEAVKAPSLYPLDNPSLRVALRTELESFVARVWDNGGSVADLLSSKEAYVNGPLAKLYGVTNGPADDKTWSWVTLPPQRAGILTRGAFLLVYSNPDIPSPIRRGSAIWRELLCATFPPPPPEAMDVKVVGGTTGAGGKPLSIREIVETKTMSAQCSGCHARINPAGHPFGHFDALGQWTDKENGVTPDGKTYTAEIDATGQLTGSDVPGTLDGAVAFSEALGKSAKVRECVARRYFNSAFGREATAEESTSLTYAEGRITETGSMREAVLAIVQSPAFQYLRKEVP